MTVKIEREVISIPASGTAELVYKYMCHAHPDKESGYNYKEALYYTFREKGGVMKKLFTLDSTLILDPYNPSAIENYDISDDKKERILDYIKDRMPEHSFNNKELNYKFYIFKEQVELPSYPKRPGQNNHCYFTLDEIYSGKELIESSNKESQISYSEENLSPYEVDKSKTYIEGSISQVIVNKYERNPKARKDCLNYYGSSCCVCNFDSKKVYKNIERSIIHVHHLKPFSEINSEYEVDPVKDLRPVCPNCHAAIHSRNPAYQVEELKVLLK